ncbi:methionine biosynthesis protein MetW [Naumannella halotolerans]|uniref:Methionine biosynthesis protein MetW n=1 Tax=Naumannella halotolerans TaxID=993414 RepID=A0A4R7J7H3_9ACTN|nr:methionine biosynthesis protein MetW [Naumannella halotolerans]TDT33391.1 methionine biosynthesis protein MetW [Naumannella halotolerans]
MNHIGLRQDLQLLAELVPNDSRVLDLGCGPGDLLVHLRDHHGCRITGVEIDPDAVLQAIWAGVPVLERDVDDHVGHFGTDSYDVVILSKTLQVIGQPAEVLGQMSRIAPTMIVSVPNFGLWRHRLRLLRGRMPMSRELPYAWYNTPNIHHATIVDLEDFFADVGLRIKRRIILDEQGRQRDWSTKVANLRAGSAVYELTR